jgi:hypothetical protein
MWTAERVVAILNLPALALPFLFTTPLTDAIFCTVLVVHFHWGKSEKFTLYVCVSQPKSIRYPFFSHNWVALEKQSWSQSYQTSFFFVFQFSLLRLSVCNITKYSLYFKMAQLNSKKMEKIFVYKEQVWYD